MVTNHKDDPKAKVEGHKSDTHSAVHSAREPDHSAVHKEGDSPSQQIAAGNWPAYTFDATQDPNFITVANEQRVRSGNKNSLPSVP